MASGNRHLLTRDGGCFSPLKKASKDWKKSWKKNSLKKEWIEREEEHEEEILTEAALAECA